MPALRAVADAEDDAVGPPRSALGVSERAPPPSGSVASLMVGAKSSLRGRTRRASVLLAICPASVALGVGAAHTAAAGATGPTRPAPALTRVISPNWSGYLVTGRAGARVSFSSATGTWKEPSVTCARGDLGDLSTVVVGLGGYGADAQSSEDVGTDANCDAAGKPTYYAWFELVPYIAYNVPTNDKVLVGDTMTGTVNILSTTLVQLEIQDQTRNWTFSRNITFSSQDTSTAEWISEAPASCLRFVCGEANLANFGTVTMRNISAIGNGATGALNNPNWTTIPIQLVPAKMSIPSLEPEQTQAPPEAKASSPAGATPGPPSPDGSSFGITWVPVASPGV